MIQDRLEFHNVAELIPAPGGGLQLARFPSAIWPHADGTRFDDAINAHGLYHQVVRQLDAHTLRIRCAHPIRKKYGFETMELSHDCYPAAFAISACVTIVISLLPLAF